MDFNNIYNINCLDGLSEIKDNSIDCIATDPPYKVTSRGNSLASGFFKTKETMNGKVFKHNTIKFKEYLPELYRVLKDGGHCYIMVNNKNLIELLNEAQKAGFHFIKSLIWDKNSKIVGTYYMSQYEYVLFFRKGKGVKIKNCSSSDIIQIPYRKTKDSNGKNIHDTEKPIELMEYLILNSTDIGDIVLDPFSGSGSTALACIKNNRQYIAFELDSNYYQTSLNRINLWKDSNGK